MSRIDTHAFGLWWKLAKGWLSTKFASINVDLTPVEEKLDDVKSDVADVKDAVEHIDLSSVAQRTDVKDGNDTAIGMLKNGTYGLAALKEAIGEGGSGDENALHLAQFFGLADSYEAEARGGERTNNTVIDECKVRFQDAFNGLLPTGFTMPNSVTVDNLTYTGTTNS